MPPKNYYPLPKKKFRRGSWEIYWNYSKKRYSIFPGFYREEDDLLVEKALRDIGKCLASDEPIFPPAFAKSNAVVQYLTDRYGITKNVPSDSGNWLIDYKYSISQSVVPRWASRSDYFLTKLVNQCGGIASVTPATARKFLDDIANETSKATRNRALSLCRRFYRWLNETGRYDANPFGGVKQEKEKREAGIVYCTPTERDELISMAKDTGWPDWVAILIAFYSGMRCEEIANLKWNDVHLETGAITVVKTKTDRSRTFPLNSTLEKYLSETLEAKRTGFVVKMPKVVKDRVWRLHTLSRKLRKIKQQPLDKAWREDNKKPVDYNTNKKKREEYDLSKEGHKQAMDKLFSCIGWNPFRHTFASLLVQKGVAIDKVSAWMGNTPEVCRRHYAQFIPRDKRDSEIDLL